MNSCRIIDGEAISGMPDSLPPAKMAFVPDNFQSLSDTHLKSVEVATAREIVRLEKAIDSKHHDARRMGKRFSKTLDTEGLLVLYDAAAVAGRTLQAIRLEQQRRLRAEIIETYGAVESSPAAD